MSTVRVIACLDVADGRVVKGERFKNLREMGDPVALSERHAEAGADEITLLDIEATIRNRATILNLVSECAEKLMVPLTVGGGINSVDAVAALLQAGADKVSVGSAGVTDSDLLPSIGTEFGNQVLVASLDVQRGATVSGFELTVHGGRTATGLDALDWIERLEDMGVGELLLNSIDADGLRAGFDLGLTERARNLTKLPIIASGGAGELAHFVDAAFAGADALLAASVFHEDSIQISQVKEALASAGFEVRLEEGARN